MPPDPAGDALKWNDPLDWQLFHEPTVKTMVEALWACPQPQREATVVVLVRMWTDIISKGWDYANRIHEGTES